MEELLGLASPRDTKNPGGHRALVDMARPGPGAGQSGGPDADLEAGSPDLVAGHRPGLPGTLGQATHLWGFSFSGDKIIPVLPAHGWPRGSNDGKIF